MFLNYKNSNKPLPPKSAFFKNPNFMNFSTCKMKDRGFTLIELLVVVAIIGIISSVVISSLSSARQKSTIATIKSTLGQLYKQATINQVNKGSFAGSNPSHLDLTCTGLKEDGAQGDSTTGNLAKIAQPLISQGIIVKCFSANFTGDAYQRFGATALIYDTGEIKAWSVDENGVVKWDTYDLNSSNLPGNNSKTWTESLTACANNGGRLPSLEQLRTLSWAWYQGSNNTTWVPVGFTPAVFWSSTASPLEPLAKSYYVHVDTSIWGGATSTHPQSTTFYARCVR